MVIASPDVGGAKRANSYSKYFQCPLVLCHKQRAKANVVESMTIIGDVKNKDVVLVDDMIDTAGTICKAADLMKENGARSVRCVTSHALMSGPAVDRINASALQEVIFTNSIPFDLSRSNKVSVISIAELFANTINCINTNQPISKFYLF